MKVNPFKNVIVSTQLSGNMGKLCHVFTGTSFQDGKNDVSFISTLRAFLIPRMPENEIFLLNFKKSMYTVDDYEKYSSKVIFSAINFINGYGNATENDRIMTVIDIDSGEEANDRAFAVIKEEMEKLEEWVRLEHVTRFFEGAFRCACYVDMDRKSTIIYVENIDLRWLHYLQTSIMAFVPYYFNVDNGDKLTALETRLINSLTRSTPDEYIECMNEYSSLFGIREAKIRESLKGFETQVYRNRIRELRSKIDDVLGKYNNYSRLMSSLLEDKENLDLEFIGIQQKIADSGGNSEIMDYFLANKNLSVEKVDGSYVTFVVSGYIEYFDEDMAADYINNRYSFIYNGDYDYSREIPADDMERLMTAIFIDRRLKIKVVAAYRMGLYGRIDGLRSYVYADAFDSYMRNPHIDEYGCLGNYEVQISEALKDHDYIGALMQCQASAQSLNFADSTVMNNFMRVIYGVYEGTGSRNNKCIELPDGSVVRPKKAIAWLKKEETVSE